MPLRGETHLPSASDAGLGRGGEGGGCVYRQPQEEPGLCETGECAGASGGSARRAQRRVGGGGVREASQAERAFDEWLERYDDKYPKATACLVRDRDELLAFYDFPAAHWTHLRTTNVIESAFATIRHRSARAKGCVTRQTMLSMIYKMGTCAEKSWRRLRGFRHLAKVIEGVQFNDGIEVIEDSRAAA